MPKISKWDDHNYSVCLVTKTGSDLLMVRGILKTEFHLKDANERFEGVYKALVFPDPFHPEDDLIYRIRFNPDWSGGPVIDFRYANVLSDELRIKSSRNEAIKRASQLVEVIDIISWSGKRLALSFLKINSSSANPN